MNLKLREIERRDISAINEWRNDEEIIAGLGAPFRFINEEVDKNWFDNYMSNRDKAVRLAIVDVSCESRGDILGIVSLTGIDYLNQCAEFHIMLSKENQGKGLGTFATREILAHAFNNMNLQRIELSVLLDNVKAIGLYEKIGFKKEGVKRNAVYKNGKFKDMATYSMLKDEFK